LDPSLNTDLVACYKDLHGVDIFDDFREEKGQNSADIWMHKLLENHSSRTYNMSEARMFYVPFYGFLSSFFSGLQSESPAGPDSTSKRGCKGVSHWDRARNLSAFLGNQTMFQQHPERHLMTVSFWAVAQDTTANYPPLAPPCVVVGELFEKLQKSVLFVYEQQFASMEKVDEHKNWAGTLISLPYVSKPSLVNNAPTTTLGHRDITFFFQGSLHHAHENSGHGLKLRQELAAVFENQPGSLIVDTAKHYTGNSYERGMQRASFCLVLEGDTPTSARLFDSIAAGCVPLILSDEITLPFASQLNWTEFSVHPFTGAYRTTKASLLESQTQGHGAMYAESSVEVAKLKRTPNDKLQKLQQVLLQVRSNFVYGYGSPYNFTSAGGPGTLVDCALQEAIKRMGIEAESPW